MTRAEIILSLVDEAAPKKSQADKDYTRGVRGSNRTTYGNRGSGQRHADHRRRTAGDTESPDYKRKGVEDPKDDRPVDPTAYPPKKQKKRKEGGSKAWRAKRKEQRAARAAARNNPPSGSDNEYYAG